MAAPGGYYGGVPGAGIAMASAVPVPSMQSMQTTAPEGSRPGDTVHVAGPHGQQLQVVRVRVRVEVRVSDR
jgi:hypothetical protein